MRFSASSQKEMKTPATSQQPTATCNKAKSYKAMARRDAHHRRTTTMIKKMLTEARSSRFSPSLPSPSIDEALDDMPSIILLLSPPLLGGHSRNKCGLEFAKNSPQFFRLLLMAKQKLLHEEPPGMKPKELQCRKQGAESKGNAIAMAITT